MSNKLAKVADLMAVLEKFDPEAEVVISLDITNAWGFGYVKKLTPGILKLTEYGNDFFPHEKMAVRKDEVHAICLYAEESTE